MGFAKLGLVLAATFVATSAVAENCSAERTLLLDAIERNRFEIKEEGFFADAFGTCKISRMELVADNVKLDVGSLEWKLSGLNALDAGAGTIDLTVKLRDFRVVPTSDDPWIGYMLDQQNRNSLIKGDLSGKLNLDTGALEIERLVVDLPRNNAVSLTMSAGGVTPAALSGKVANFAALSLSRMELVLTNNGFADGLILGALMGAMSDLPGSPESQMDATRRDARAIVDGLPDDLLVEGSKEALGQLIDDAPVPWGTLGVTLHADPALPMLRFSALALASDPLDPGALGFAFSGADVEVTYLPSAGAE